MPAVMAMRRLQRRLTTAPDAPIAVHPEYSTCTVFVLSFEWVPPNDILTTPVAKTD
jgi:hypothetical protein